MNNSLQTSLVRTLIPYIVGGVISWLATKGIDVKTEDIATLSAFLTVVLGWLYYYAVRFLESKNPSFGKLLGVAKQPTYPKGG